MDEYLVGVRLRPTAQADDYRVGELELHVGDLVWVETIERPGPLYVPPLALEHGPVDIRIEYGDGTAEDWPAPT